MAERAGARRGPPPTAVRFQRLMLMLPWLMQRGEATVAEVAARFHVSEAELVRDLELAATCGLPPFQDEMIDLYIDEGPQGQTIYTGIPRFFTRPLRLTAPEGLALLTAGRAALVMPGADNTGPLSTALDKLEQRLGSANVAVDTAKPGHADALVEAGERGAVLEIRYWTASRDEVTQRRIVPRLVFTDRGDWYVVADDERSGEERTFRVDRIHELMDTGETVPPRHVEAPTADWFADDDVAQARVVVQPGSEWVAERYPIRSAIRRADGSLEIVLAVVSEVWFARMLLRLGPGATVLEPPQWRDLSTRTAARVLARYCG